MLQEALSISAFRSEPSGIRINKASGCYLFSETGRRFLDMSGGSGAVNLGHSHPEVVETISRQSKILIHTGWNIDHPHRHEMIERLSKFLPYKDASIIGAVTGAEAVEVALKIARKFSGRSTILHFENSFHGKSQGALSVTSNPLFRQHLSCLQSENPRFSLEEKYLKGEEGASEFGSDFDASLRELAAAGRLPAAVIVEPIQAAEGIYAIPKVVLNAIVECCKRYEVLSIFDEIYTGFGRTGAPFVADEFSFPDLLVLGKALGNGLPISAVVGASDLVDCLAYSEHSSTFTFSPLVTSVACTVLDVFSREKTWLAAAEEGIGLRKALLELQEDTKRIKNIRGRGLMQAFEIRLDSPKAAGSAMKNLRERLLSNGVLVRTGGASPLTVKLTPPLVFRSQHRSELMSALRDSLDQVEF